MWVVKTHGETFYVNHVTADMPWSTKETPSNSHTKGSIKFKECLLVINEDNEATLSQLSVIDKIRLRKTQIPFEHHICRVEGVIFARGGQPYRCWPGRLGMANVGTCHPDCFYDSPVHLHPYA